MVAGNLNPAHIEEYFTCRQNNFSLRQLLILFLCKNFYFFKNLNPKSHIKNDFF